MLACLANERLRPLTLGVGMLTIAAPSGTGGTLAAVTDGGGGADTRRASNRLSYERFERRFSEVMAAPNGLICAP